jgi:predicted transposase/invertase (TIGR01784 family)
MQNILNPKNDIVFKLFFSKEKNKPLLISFLESVLVPLGPIDDITLLNPQITKNMVDEKSSILDLVIQLKDGSKYDVEMQMAPTPHFRKRLLYYWAKLHQTQLQTGDNYQKLLPTISIAILDYEEFKNSPDEAHSIFELREKERSELYLPDLQLHFIELPKFEAWTKRSQIKYDSLRKWMYFFKIKDDTENCTKEMAKDPMMRKAIDALEELSEEPSAQELAEMREKARVNLQLITQGAYSEGLEKGKLEGLAKAQERTISLMLKKGMSVLEIANILEISVTDVE